MKTTKELLDLWDFSWGVMNVMIGGRSAVDLESIRVKDEADAIDFLQHYGFDPENPADQKFIQAIMVEAYHVISHYLMPGEWKKGKRPPEDLFYEKDLRKILLWAASTDPQFKMHQAWACSLLRVMHTIAHIEGVHRAIDTDVARDQIMGRISQFFFKENNRLFFGTKSLHVPLYKFEWKRAKRRESMIIKLLHKKGNVAETIFDLMGLRIVTKNLSDVMLVVKLLREHYMITFPNCNPGRARNTLLDMEHFKLNIEVLRGMLKEGRISTKEFENLVERVVMPLESPRKQVQNPHTGVNYRSIQLTCRQMIQAPSSHQRYLEKLKVLLEETAPTDPRFKDLEKLYSLALSYELAYPSTDYGFFPFEVHVLDREAYLSNKGGAASHDRYKGSQAKTARRRVLGTVLTLKYPKTPSTKP